MENYEMRVLAAVEAGEKVEYAVVPIYQEGQIFPIAVSIHAEGNKGFNLSVTVLNTPKP
jgi:hypothetical protein